MRKHLSSVITVIPAY